MQRRNFIQVGLMTSLVPSSWAQASAWPQKPVKLILSQPAGSGPDIIARYLGDLLAKTWGQPVVVDNRPGGQNVIGAQAAARAGADGYSFYFGTTAAMITNLYTFKSLPYDPVKDFAGVRLVARSPFVVATAAQAPIKDFRDALAQAKAQPGKIAMATEGPKTFSGMLASYLSNLGGASFNLVPYNKAPDALQDLLGGRIALVCLPNAALSSYIKSGQVRALAVSTSERLAEHPQAVSMSEVFPGFEYTGWNGIFAPAGTPADIVGKFNRDLETLLQQPEVVQKMMSLGSMAVQGMSVADFEAYLRKERERWESVVKVLGIAAE
jgi:tripartite-type tricarboxylate transporter receptor subunit TctC